MDVQIQNKGKEELKAKSAMAIEARVVKKLAKPATNPRPKTNPKKGGVARNQPRAELGQKQSVPAPPRKLILPVDLDSEEEDYVPLIRKKPTKKMPQVEVTAVAPNANREEQAKIQGHAAAHATPTLPQATKKTEVTTTTEKQRTPTIIIKFPPKPEHNGTNSSRKRRSGWDVKAEEKETNKDIQDAVKKAKQQANFLAHECKAVQIHHASANLLPMEAVLSKPAPSLPSTIELQRQLDGMQKEFNRYLAYVKERDGSLLEILAALIAVTEPQPFGQNQA